MLNRCEFIGNLGKDPETHTTQGGDKVVSFSLAVTEKWKDQSGERKERTEWVRVVIWNQGLGGVAEKYLSKGSKCFVSGQMQTRKWKDREGVERYSTEVVLGKFRGELELLDGKDRSDDTSSSTSSSEASKAESYQTDLDDDIPF